MFITPACDNLRCSRACSCLRICSSAPSARTALRKSERSTAIRNEGSRVGNRVPGERMSSRDFNFSGGPGAVHEVAALVSGLLVAGHFDVAEAADAAIARLGDTYTALWSTLNPLA